MHNMGFTKFRISSLFDNEKLQRVFEQAENQNALDSVHEISFKLNGKCWRNYKLPSLVIILTSCYRIVVKSQAFIKNLK